MMRGGLRARARYGVLATALLATSVGVVATPAQAADTTTTTAPFVFGSGAASATVARARLFYGGLSLPAGVGTSSASYTNQSARALGIAMDLGAYVGLAGDVPKQFQPATVDSNNGDKKAKGNLEAGEAIARVDLEATRTPSSSADVHMADIDLPALVRVEGAHTNSAVGVVDKKQRRAMAIADVARVEIANGLVVLEGLHWEAIQRTGFEAISDATFDVAGLRIAGLKVPIKGGDLNNVLNNINNALVPVGLRVVAPTKTISAEGAVGMSPLRVELANSPLGKQLLGPIIASARPLIAPAMDALLKANKTLGLVGLVADIVLGVADGSGGVEVGIGGTTATTSSTGFVAKPGVNTVGPLTPSDTTFNGTPATNVSPETIARETGGELIETPAQAASRGPLRCVLEAGPRRKGDCRDSNVATAVVITAVAVIGLVAAEFASRRRRRRRSDEVVA